MADPAYVGVGAKASGDNPGTLTPDLPAGVASGDLMVAVIAGRNNGSAGTATFPAGWDQQVNYHTTGQLLAIATRSWVLGDSGPVISLAGFSAGDTAIARVTAFTNCDGIDVVGTSTHNVSQANIGPVSGITPATAKAPVIAVGMRNKADGTYAFSGGDGLTWAQISLDEEGAGSDATLVWNYALNWASGAISDKTWTITAGSSLTAVGVVISLHPTGTVTPPSPGGAITGPGGLDTSDTNPDSAIFDANTVQPIIAVPDDTHLFGGWTGDASGNANPLNVLMSTDKSIGATWTAASGGGGDLSGAVIDGSGNVLFQDLLTAANAHHGAWNITTPDNDDISNDPAGIGDASDTYLTQESGDGSPYVPIGGTVANTDYYRSRAAHNVQSLYDAHVAHNNATRTQMLKGYHWTAGSHTCLYFDLRLMSPNDFPFPASTGGGNLRFSQIAQVKPYGAAGSTFLVIYGANNGFKLTYGTQVQDLIAPCASGVWHRIGLEMFMGAGNTGWAQLWADLDQSGNMLKIGARHTNLQLIVGGIVPWVCFGLYHQMVNFTDPVHIDFANITVCAVA